MALALAAILLGATAIPPDGIDVVERLGEPIPRGLSFADESGRPVRLDDALAGGKPVLLSLVYFQCPTLCNLLLQGLVKSLRQTGLALGADYRALTVSFDPADTPAAAAERQRGNLATLGRPHGAAAWPFLTGREEAVRALAEGVGFVYRAGSSPADFAHAAVAFVLTPDGRISRYLYGVEHAPRDLRLSLAEASGGKVGTTLDRFLLRCTRWDPAARKYRLFVSGFLRTGALLVFAALASLLAFHWRRELRKEPK